MDLLDKMGAVTSEEVDRQWIDARAGLAAIALAGEKAGGRNLQEKVK